MSIERSNKVIRMITGMVEYIDSFDSPIEKKINMEAATMTMIDIIADANGETPFETINRLTKNFKSIRKD